MRRIPRAQRSIDQAIASPLLARQCLSASPCCGPKQRALLPTTSAPFSTSQRLQVFDVKQDARKKHMAMVRKWQKRIHGDSEPIGHRVDPYDPTSPVRLAPEELGEEMEILEEEERGEGAPYEPAYDATGLERVGGRTFVKQHEEMKLAERFEVLVAKRSIARYSFGREVPLTQRRALLDSFHQAVVEVYTLKEAGANLDLASYPHEGNYGKPPFKYSSVSVSLSPANELVLNYPYAEAKAKLLDNMQNGQPRSDLLEEEEIVDEAEEYAETTETPAGESEGRVNVKTAKPFDFMSSHVSGSAPVAEPTTTGNMPEVDLEGAIGSVQDEIVKMREAVLETAATRSERVVADLREVVQSHLISAASRSVTVVEPELVPVTYGRVKLNDPAIKFAISKRLLQLTGHRLSDPQLLASDTLSDLLQNLVSLTRPKPTKLFDMVRKGNSFTKLSNVQLYPRKVSERQKEKQVGRWKVIEYALTERDLPVSYRDAPPNNTAVESFDEKEGEEWLRRRLKKLERMQI